MVTLKEKLVCDKCGQAYIDLPSIDQAKKYADFWAMQCRRDGVEPRGIGPCPVFTCRGELIYTKEE